MITKDVGATPAEIITKRGEVAFREIEKKAVHLVSALDNVVISTGGGVPLDPDNMKSLTERGETVWLKVLPETVLKRAGNLKSRPLIDPKDPLNSIKTKMAARESAYAKARHKIESDALTVNQVADQILSLFPALQI
jgi:shikimate kinase